MVNVIFICDNGAERLVNVLPNRRDATAYVRRTAKGFPRARVARDGNRFTVARGGFTFFRARIENA